MSLSSVPLLASKFVSQVNMLKSWSAVEICFVIAICHQIHGVRRRSNSTLKYGNFAYSVYASLDFTNNSTIQLRFKTAKKQGMLFYMDDGGVKEFMDAFLVNGQVRLRLNIGSCQRKQKFSNETFTDLKWHKLTLRRDLESVVLAIDRIPPSHIYCKGIGHTGFTKTSHLFVSSFPTEEWRHIKWTFRDSLWSSIRQGGFEGCMKPPRYSIGGKKYRQVRLVKSERTVPGCSNACHDSRYRGKCYNGGKCLNKIVRTECNCKGTGYTGPNCSETAHVDASAGLRFHNSSKESYAEFQGWPMPHSSELQLYFKTHQSSKTALLLYQDDGGRREFIKISLVNGRVNLHLIGKRCTPSEVVVRGNFANASWHELIIKREINKLSLIVDDHFVKKVICDAVPGLSSNGKAKSSLYMGGIPLLDSQGHSTDKRWSAVSLFYDVVHRSSWFQGCVALVRYRSGSEPFENAKLLRSPGVSGNCSGEACSSRERNKCKNGGRCIDLVVRAECDCNGTGYYGRYCNQPGPDVETHGSTATAFVDKENLAPEHHVTSLPTLRRTKSEPTARKAHKGHNRASFPSASIQWCLLLILIAFFELLVPF